MYETSKISMVQGVPFIIYKGGNFVNENGCDNIATYITTNKARDYVWMVF